VRSFFKRNTRLALILENRTGERMNRGPETLSENNFRFALTRGLCRQHHFQAMEWRNAQEFLHYFPG
jgi:hypothetical protein